MNIEKIPVGEIAAGDIRKAEILKRSGIDFCCGGKRSLEQACIEDGANIKEVQAKLSDADSVSITAHTPDYHSWDPGFLADYIVNIHHRYVRNSEDLLKSLGSKVSGHHGERIPQFIEVERIINRLLDELTSHMKYEETVLFPAIKEVAAVPSRANVYSDILKMEDDHEEAGMLLKQLQTITNDYTIPEGSCNSVKLYYHKLNEFHNDLIQHVHLENNILFPATKKILN